MYMLLVKRIRLFLPSILAIFVISLGITAFVSPKVFADEHDQKIKAWAYYIAQDGSGAVEGCMYGLTKIGNDNLSADGKTMNGNGYIDYGVTRSHRGILGQEKKCSQVYSEGAPLWGFTGVTDLLKSAGYKQKGSDLVLDSKKAQTAINNAIRKKMGFSGNNIDEYLTPPEVYSYHYQNLKNSCDINSETRYDSVSDTTKAEADGGSGQYIKYLKLDKDNKPQWVIAKYNDHGVGGQCKEKANNVTNSVKKAATYSADEKKKSQEKAGKDAVKKAFAPLIDKICEKTQCNDNDRDTYNKQIERCWAEGIKHAGDAEDENGSLSSNERDASIRSEFKKCIKKVAPSLSDTDIDNAISGVSQSQIDANTNVDTGAGEDAHKDGEAGEEAAKTQCAIDGIGWIVCPVVNFLAKISDDSASILTKLLQVNSKILTDRGTDSTFHYWSRIRDIANIVFIIVFLIVIYSQVTGLGISNYGIKKLLPKLLMTIILVNVSFYVCSILVDISNIVGSSSFHFISTLGGGGNGPEGGWATKGNGFFGFAATILAGVASFFLLSVLISGLIFVVVTTTVTVFLLGARQALIIFMIVLSPLALVALLLPSTEGLFKKWWGLFKTLLFLYPAVGLLYGACNLGATIINGLKGETSGMLQIVGAVLTFTPLLLVSRLTNLMTSMMGLSNIANKWGQVAGNAMGKKSQKMLNESKWGKYMDHRDQVKAERRAQIQAGTYRGTKNPATWGRAARSWVSGKANRVIEVGANKFNNEAAKRMIEDLGKEASWQEEKRYDESIKKAKTMYESDVSFIDSGTGKETRLGNGQFVDMARGLVKPNIKPTDSAGNVITSIPLPQTTSERRYVLDRAGRSANAQQFVQLAELANSLESEGERLALASALSASSGAKKHGWFDGGAYNDIKDGNFDLQQSIVRSINKEKFGKPEEIANMDQASTKIINDALAQPGPRVGAQELKQAQQRLQESARLALKDKQVKNEIRSRQSIKDTVDNWSRGKF